MPREFPFQPLGSNWLHVLHKAAEHKKAEFQDDADEAMRFFDGPHDFVYSGEYADRGSGMYLASENMPAKPTFRMTINKVAEMVQLYGPHLYHRNPARQVKPRKYPDLPPEIFGDPNDPNAQQFQQMVAQQAQSAQTRHQVMSVLMGGYLNYTPNETDLKSQSRLQIDETIIKGASTMWVEVFSPPGAQTKIIRSTYDSIDNLLVDPDAENLLDAKWIARRRIMPVWEAEHRFGLKRGTLRGSMESLYNQGVYAGVGAEGDYWRSRGDTNDLLTFFEIYSRMGMGNRIQKSYNSAISSGPPDEFLDKFGDFVYLAISEEHPWPLNLPEDVVKRGNFDEMFMRAQWPTPFWADAYSPWPCQVQAFHHRPRKLWPMSHLKPALGELIFLDWAFSFLADKIKNTSRDFIAIAKSAPEDLKTAILSGRDLTLLELEGSFGKISDVIQFLQHPGMNDDIFKVIEYVMRLFEERTGINELLTRGTTSTQIRSAKEASLKGDMVRVRPDDMAQMVESGATELARKEAIAARWHLGPQDVLPPLGPMGAQLWGEIVSTADLPQIVAELEYRIEAGSIRKPNAAMDVENAQQASQVWGQVWKDYGFQSGDFGPLNELWQFWAKSHQMTDPEKYVLRPPPPKEGPSPEEIKAQLEQQRLQIEQQKAQMEMQKLQQQMEMERQKMMVNLSQDAAEHTQEMVQSEEEHDQDLDHEREQSLLKLDLMRQEGNLRFKLAKQQTSQKAAVQGNGKEK